MKKDELNPGMIVILRNDNEERMVKVLPDKRL